MQKSPALRIETTHNHLPPGLPNALDAAAKPPAHMSSGCAGVPDTGHHLKAETCAMPVKPEPIMKIALGYMAAKFLFAANEIGLFEALAQGAASLEELSKRTSVPLRTTGIVVAALVSLGIIEQEGEHYRNGEAAATFLAGERGIDLRPMLRNQDVISYPMWTKFSEVVRAGGRQPQFGNLDEVQQQIFSAGVEAFTAPVAAALGTTYDFSHHQRLLDIGGGTGSFL